MTYSVSLCIPADDGHRVNSELNRRREKTPDMPELRNIDHHLVFVYGSLMHGFGNHYLLRKSEYLGVGRTMRDEYEMYVASGFPVLREAPNKEGNYVYGEVYAVGPDELSRLDFLESNGTMYTRKKTSISLREQSFVTPSATRAYPFEQCWCYFGEEDYWDGFKTMKEVPLTLPKGSSDDGVGLKWNTSFLGRLN